MSNPTDVFGTGTKSEAGYSEKNYLNPLSYIQDCNEYIAFTTQSYNTITTSRRKREQTFVEFTFTHNNIKPSKNTNTRQTFVKKMEFMQVKKKKIQILLEALNDTDNTL